jgi:ABC-type multidrug transport system ATPase subunit
MHAFTHFLFVKNTKSKLSLACKILCPLIFSLLIIGAQLVQQEVARATEEPPVIFYPSTGNINDAEAYLVPSLVQECIQAGNSPECEETLAVAGKDRETALAHAEDWTSALQRLLGGDRADANASAASVSTYSVKLKPRATSFSSWFDSRPRHVIGVVGTDGSFTGARRIHLGYDGRFAPQGYRGSMSAVLIPPNGSLYVYSGMATAVSASLTSWAAAAHNMSLLDEPTQDLDVRQLPTSSRHLNILSVAGSSMAQLYLWCFIPLAISTASGLVTERVTGLREGLFLMGLAPRRYWLSHLTVAATFATATVTLMVGSAFAGGVFSYSTPSLILTLFLAMAAAVLAFSFCLSSLVASPRASSFITFFFFYLVGGLASLSTSSLSASLLGPLFPSVFVTAIQLCLNYEGLQAPLTWEAAFNTRDEGLGTTVGACLLWLLADAVLLLAAGYAASLAFPGPYGTPRSLLPRWLRAALCAGASLSPSLASVEGVDTGEAGRGGDGSTGDAAHAEALREARARQDEAMLVPEQAAPASRTDQDIVLRIEALGKTFGSTGQRAVDGLCLSVARGEILALLGSNGAGKTTTINCVTGYLPATDGRIVLAGERYGPPSFGGSSSAPRKVGVCPQHECLFGEMDAVAHVRLALQLRGEQPTDAAVHTALADVGLAPAFHGSPVRTFSGGMRRKVQIAMALAGSPDLVCCDEPASSLDVDAQQHIWHLLRSCAGDKPVIVTTHRMLEAEVLGDVVAIMAGGRLRVKGSPAYLKEQLGSGYRLSGSTEAETAVIGRQAGRLCPSASVSRDARGRRTVTVPLADRATLPAILEACEAEKVPVSLSLSSLDDVFLAVCGAGQESGVGEEREKEEEGSSTGRRTDDGPHSFGGLPFRSTDLPRPPVHAAPFVSAELTSERLPLLRVGESTGLAAAAGAARGPGLWAQAAAVLRARFTLLRSARLTALAATLLPAALLALSLATSLAVQRAGIVGPFLPVDEAGVLLDASAVPGVVPYVIAPAVEGPTASALVAALRLPLVHWSGSEDEMIRRIAANHGPSGYAGALALREAEDGGPLPGLTLYANYTGHPNALLALVGAVTNARLSLLLPPSLSSSLPSPVLHTWPLPALHLEAAGALIPLFLGPLIVAARGALLAARERERQLSSVLAMAGLRPAAYWTAAVVSDAAFLSPCLALLVATLALFDAQGYSGPRLFPTAVLLVVNGASTVILSLSLSLPFSAAKSAVTFVPLIIVGSAVTWIIGLSLINTYAFTIPDPTYAYIRCLHPTSCFLAELSALPGYDESFFAWHRVGKTIVLSLCSSLALFLSLPLFLDPTVRAKPAAVRRNTGPPPRFASRPETGVADEQETAEVALETASGGIVAAHLRKTFPRRSWLATKLGARGSGDFVAAGNVSLVARPGSVLGLVGPNGSGKSTTISLITRQAAATAGDAAVAGHSVTEAGRLRLYRGGRRLSACPQGNPTHEGLSALDHLTLVLAIRGSEGGGRDRRREKEEEGEGEEVVDAEAYRRAVAHQLCALVGIAPADRTKPSATLSGGTVRKLSLALTLASRPAVVLLDEPTAGLDPIARSLIYKTFKELTKGGATTILLTSHELEEVEGLSDRVALLVQGEVRGVGGTSELGERLRTRAEAAPGSPFARGPGTRLALRLHRSPTLSRDMAALCAHVRSTFPGSREEEVFGTRAVFRLPPGEREGEREREGEGEGSRPLSAIFRHLLTSLPPSLSLSLSDWSVSSPTLEHAFLACVREEEREREREAVQYV